MYLSSARSATSQAFVASTASSCSTWASPFGRQRATFVVPWQVLVSLYLWLFFYVELLFHDDFQPKALGSAVWRTLERELPKSILGSLIFFFFFPHQAVLGQKADIIFLSQSRLSSAPYMNVRVYVLLGCASATGFPVVSTTGTLFCMNSLWKWKILDSVSIRISCLGLSICTDPECESYNPQL